MKTILVPCDFSKPAIDAYRVAVDVAAQSRGTIHLLNVVELPVLHDTVLMPVLNFEQELLNELKTKGERRFKKIVEKYTKPGIKTTTKVEFGHVFTMIQDYVKDNNIDIVIMGSHGAGGLRELLIGSNAEKVVRSSAVPVLIVKNYSKAPVKNIVFPNTLETDTQEELTMRVKALQNFFKAHLHIVWINTPLNFASDSITLNRLDTFAKRYMLKNYTIHVYNHRDEEYGILEFANSVKADLIAIGTHGRRGIAHVLNGSLAEDIVNHSANLVWVSSLKNKPVTQPND
jgi:nucleotide-binding universal stress UspA family protein